MEAPALILHEVLWYNQFLALPVAARILIILEGPDHLIDRVIRWSLLPTGLETVYIIPRSTFRPRLSIR